MRGADKIIGSRTDLPDAGGQMETVGIHDRTHDQLGHWNDIIQH